MCACMGVCVCVAVPFSTWELNLGAWVHYTVRLLFGKFFAAGLFSVAVWFYWDQLMAITAIFKPS